MPESLTGLIHGEAQLFGQKGGGFLSLAGISSDCRSFSLTAILSASRRSLPIRGLWLIPCFFLIFRFRFGQLSCIY